MSIKIAINGFGRIGRLVLKAAMENRKIRVVGINDLCDTKTLAHLLRYDSVHGKFPGTIKAKENSIVVNGYDIKVSAERDPTKLPWNKLNVELVFESTGIFTKTEDLKKHIQAGAKYAVLSAPTTSSDMPTIVHGVNSPDNKPVIFSCASCTTNCITPIVEIMDRRIGVEKAIMTTVHAYTSTQALVDAPIPKDFALAGT